MLWKELLYLSVIPGSGKSTLLNICIGRVIFTSETSIGTGRTTAMQMETVGNITYCDTPGLDDIDKRTAAAHEIGRAFNENKVVSLIFVITLESGRLRPSDIGTIKIGLNSITGTGVNMDKGYSIILNKLSSKTIEKLNEGYPKEDLFGVFKYDFGEPKDLMYIKLDEKAFDEDNVILHCASELREFINKCPRVRVDQCIRIDSIKWGHILSAIYHKLQIFTERALRSCVVM